MSLQQLSENKNDFQFEKKRIQVCIKDLKKINQSYFKAGIQ